MRTLTTDDLTRLSGMTSELHAAGERFAHTMESGMRNGSFDKVNLGFVHRVLGLSSGKENEESTNLLGYLARNNRASWENRIESLRSRYNGVDIHDSTKGEKSLESGDTPEEKLRYVQAVNDYLDQLKTMHERTNIFGHSVETRSQPKKAFLKLLAARRAYHPHRGSPFPPEFLHGRKISVKCS